MSSIVIHTETEEKYDVKDLYAWRKNQTISNAEFIQNLKKINNKIKNDHDFPGEYNHFKNKKYKAYKIVIDSIQENY